MNAFPFGLPGATTAYMALYMVTWMAHFALAGAVLGGAFVAAHDAFRGGDPDLDRRRTAAAIGAALPLLLGLAITAGVGPLLLVQILYRDAFYTANLLLFVRYLLILPALLVCFYLFYLARSGRAAAWSERVRALLWGVAAAMALFIAWSNVELHSLSLAPGSWIEHYGESRLFHAEAPVLWRLGAFIGLALVMTAAGGALLSRLAGHPRSAWCLAPLALVGAFVALASGALYGRTLAVDAAAILRTTTGLIHLVVLAVSAIVVCGAWASGWARRSLSTTTWRAVLVASIAWLYAIAILRELVRGAELDLPSRFEVHRQAAESGGVVAFIAFAMINGAAIGWCLTRVWKRAREAS